MESRTRKRLAGLAVVGLAVGGLGATAWAQTSDERPTLGAAVAAETEPGGARKERRFGPLRRAVHGDLVVKGKDGAFVPVTFDRGKVTAASATSVSIERPDGVKVTVTVTPETTFRGVKDAAALKVGEPALMVSEAGKARTIGQRDPARRAGPSAPPATGS